MEGAPIALRCRKMGAVGTIATIPDLDCAGHVDFALMAASAPVRGSFLLQEAIPVSSILIRPSSGRRPVPQAAPQLEQLSRLVTAGASARCNSAPVCRVRRGGSFRFSLPLAKSSSRLTGRRVIKWFTFCRQHAAACASKGGKDGPKARFPHFQRRRFGRIPAKSIHS